jgi:signal transduction histidine kinase
MSSNAPDHSENDIQRHIEQLQSIYQLSNAVSHAEALEDVYRGALDGLQRTLKVDRASILLLDPDGVMRFKAWSGVSDRYREAVDGHSPWQTDTPHPEPILVTDLETESSLLNLIPVLRAEGVRSMGFIPLLHRGRLTGKLTICYDERHPFTEEEVQLSQTVASLIAFALERKIVEEERTHLLNKERETRAAAEETQHRLKFLLDASSVLSSSLDYKETLERLARMSVGLLGDLCLIDMLEEDGSIARMASVHRDPEKEALADRLGRDYPPDPNGNHPVARALRTGKSEFQAEMPPQFLKDTTRDEEHFKIVRALGFSSYICIPLIAHQKKLGAITLVSTDPERRFNEQEMTLAQELARRAAIAVDNARLYREIQDTNRAKDQFLAILGHELRNPLSPLLNALYLLKMKGSDPATLERVREVMDRQVRLMASLIDDLLDVSRISRGIIEIRPIRLDLARLARDTAEDRRASIEAAKLRLRLELPECPVWVEGDPTRLSQVLGNLLQNAMKFTNAGGEIAVRLTPQPDSQGALISVKDTGIGMEPETVSRVFDLFAQADRSAERNRGGLGLGLALVKGLVGLHGGNVQAKSEGLGNGSEFVVWLPLAGESSVESHRSSVESMIKRPMLPAQ